MAKKPSLVANLVLLSIVLLLLGGVGALSWWGFKKFTTKDDVPATGAVEAAVAPNTNAATTETPAEDLAAKELAAKELAAKEAAAKELAAKELAAKELAAKELAAKEAAAKEAAAKEAAAKEAAAKELAAKEAAAKELAAKEAAARENMTTQEAAAAAAKEAAAKEALAMQEAAAKEAAAKEAAAKEAAAKEAAAKEAAANATQATEIPVPVAGMATSFKVFPIDSPEGKALLDDAERRIQEAPEELYSPQKKIMVRRGLRSARSLARVATVFYGVGKTDIGETGAKTLTESLKGDEVKAILRDPKAVVFVLGFSDPSGSAGINQNLAKVRAEGVQRFLVDGKLVRNDVHPIAIGSTEVISEANKAKNRAAEIWIVMQ